MKVDSIRAHITASAAQALIQQSEIARLISKERGRTHPFSKGRAIQPIEEVMATYEDSEGRGRKHTGLDVLA